MFAGVRGRKEGGLAGCPPCWLGTLGVGRAGVHKGTPEDLDLNLLLAPHLMDKDTMLKPLPWSGPRFPPGDIRQGAGSDQLEPKDPPCSDHLLSPRCRGRYMAGLKACRVFSFEWKREKARALQLTSPTNSWSQH